MANYAVISGNTVINTISALSLEAAEEATGFTCIEYTTESPAGIGYTWNGSVFTAPEE